MASNNETLADFVRHVFYNGEMQLNNLLEALQVAPCPKCKHPTIQLKYGGMDEYRTNFPAILCLTCGARYERAERLQILYGDTDIKRIP